MLSYRDAVETGNDTSAIPEVAKGSEILDEPTAPKSANVETDAQTARVQQLVELLQKHSEESAGKRERSAYARMLEIAKLDILSGQCFLLSH